MEKWNKNWCHELCVIALSSIRIIITCHLIYYLFGDVTRRVYDLMICIFHFLIIMTLRPTLKRLHWAYRDLGTNENIAKVIMSCPNKNQNQLTRHYIWFFPFTDIRIAAKTVGEVPNQHGNVRRPIDGARREVFASHDSDAVVRDKPERVAGEIAKAFQFVLEHSADRWKGRTLRVILTRSAVVDLRRLTSGT